MLNRIRSSLVLKSGLAAAALATAVVLGAAVISYRTAGAQMTKMLENEMDSRAKVIAAHLGNELRHLFETLSEMSGNTLFANALADSDGRDHYLRPFLNSFQQVGTIPVHIILCDFKGDALETNPVPPMTDADPDFIRQTVDSGKSLFRLDPAGGDVTVTMVFPVFYANTGLPEGALACQFGFHALTSDVFTKQQNESFRILFSESESQTAFSILQGDSPPDGPVFRRTDVDAAGIFPGWSVFAEVWEDQNILKAGLRRLAGGYALIGFLGLLVIVPVSGAGARWILARLKVLEAVSRSVVETKSLDQKFPEKGGDEIANLGRAFNQMLDDLKQAYETLRSEAVREMRRQTERFRRVLSETLEGYVRVNMKTRVIEEVNDAFCRMTGQECVMWEGRPVPDFLEKYPAHAEAASEAVSWTEEGEIPGPEGRAIAVLVHCSLDIDAEDDRQLVAFLTDISDQKAAEAETQLVNDQLVRSVAALEKRDRELTLLNRMNDLLLASRKSDEAFEIVRLTATKLFPDASGALAVLNPESRLLETVIEWGRADMISPQFHIEDCWGMRQGSLHELADAAEGLVCPHITGKIKQASLCAPLVVQGKTIGLLWSELIGEDRIAREGMRRLIISLGDALKLAISNIELREALEEQATHDPLTGLYNRRYFSKVMGQELARTKRSERRFTLAIADIDHFKHFNDSFGHDAGDRVLVELAALFRRELRSTDMAFRFGGEEFVILLPDTDMAGGLNCLDALRRRLEQQEVHHDGQSLGTITMSAGLAQYPEHGQKEEYLIRLADMALYQAKESGRNRVLAAT